MKTSQNFGILYVLLVMIQVLICNYCRLSPYITLSMLPAMVLCLPLGIGTVRCMVAAFISALCVDWLSEGLIGINAAALLPVAFLKTGIIRIFIGEDIISRKDSFSLRKNGIGKISIIILAALTIYLCIYILLDGAGTRPLWFNIARFCASLACNWILSIAVVRLLMPDDRK